MITLRRRGGRVGLLAILLLLGSLSAGAAGGGEDAAAGEDLARLASFMAGAFSSQRQAERDSSFYDVRLKMAPIWVDRGDGYWFYVEQAMNSHLGRPYRQRVYHLTETSPGKIRSDVYTMAEPKRFVGAWSRREPMAGLTPEMLELRDGCAIHFRGGIAGLYRGGTVGKGCRSSLRGASYATSEVYVTEQLVASWDRGFDAGGNQVWGAVSGPYLFDRLTDWSGRLGRRETVHDGDAEPGWGRRPRGRSR